MSQPALALATFHCSGELVSIPVNYFSFPMGSPTRIRLSLVNLEVKCGRVIVRYLPKDGPLLVGVALVFLQIV